MKEMLSAVSWLAIVGAAVGWEEATVYAEDGWLSMAGRTLNEIDDYTVDSENLELSKYGGWKARQVDAGTGFFRVEQVDGRWWVVDPEGYLYIHKALNTVNLNHHTADEIYDLLHEYGFNGAGSWSDEAFLESSKKDTEPLAYCPKISFLGLYAREREVRILCPVFDDAFETFAYEAAKDFLPYVNDPQVFGYFTDNEISWTYSGGLSFHLALDDATDQNYQRAIEFINELGITEDEVTEEDKDDYAVIMADRYYSVIWGAIRSVDTNHMIIGSRVNKPENRPEGFFKAAAPYVDIFSINHYHRWGSRDAQVIQWAEWMGVPLLISEFYAMQENSSVEEQGAGWHVADQTSRGIYFQNFVISLLETKVVVGFHWFRFEDQASDTGNKGVVALNGTLYTTLLEDYMKPLFEQIYNYVDYFDSKGDPNVALIPEADTYYKSSTNYGSDPELWLKQAASAVYRAAYLRFDLSSLNGDIASATLKIFSVGADTECGEYQAQFVADDSWEEMELNKASAPTGSTVLGTWGHGGDVAIDVTTDVAREAAGDGLVTFLLSPLLQNTVIALYGSKENENELAWPKLYIRYTGDTYHAEDFSSQSGVQVQGKNLAFVNTGDWVQYDNMVLNAGSCEISILYSSQSTASVATFEKTDGTVLATISLPSTGSWTTFGTASTTLTLSTYVNGVVVRFSQPSGSSSYLCNIDWFRVVQDTPIVIMRKSNSQSYAIDGSENGGSDQDVALASYDSSSATQQWEELDRGNGYYTYQKVGTSYSMDGGDGGAANQNVNLQKTDPDDYNQHWKKVDMGTGYYQLQKRNALGYCIDGGSGGAAGQSLELYSSSSTSNNLQWLFEYQ